MSTRSAVAVAIASTTTIVVAFCAWFLRPVSDAERLETFPRTLAAMACEERWGELEARLDPEFRMKGVPGQGTLTRAETIAGLRALVARDFFPVVAHVVPVHFDDLRHRVVVYGLLIEGDPTLVRAPKTRPVRVEALIETRGREFVVLEATM
jgi:hypothetical protein